MPQTPDHPDHDLPVATVQRESDTPQGWEHRVAITKGESQAIHIITTSFQDHDLWSGGTASPAEIAARAAELIAAMFGPVASRPLPEKFDASLGRRLDHSFDAKMRGHSFG